MSSSGYVIPVDPAEMASRFAAADDPRFEDEMDDTDLESVSEEDVAAFFSSTGNDFESKVAPLLDRIPERESDLIYLYFIQGKRQADIAEIFGVTQAAVSYRLDRGIKRIQFLLSIPQVTEDELRRDLPAVFPTSSPCPKCLAAGEEDGPLETTQPCICQGSGAILIDVEILVGMWATTCQSEVATLLGLTQGRVRHRFFKAVKVLDKAAEANEQLAPYFKIFRAISSKKFNILREVKLPQWADRGGDECF